MSDLQNARGFDFHCHVDLHRDPADLVRRCEALRIVTLAVTTTPRAWPQNRAWTTKSPYVYAAAGLHPELVGERHEEIGLLEEYMQEARFVGEVGLDGSARYRHSFEVQQDIFRRVLKSAEALRGRVITIHSRAAAREVIDMIKVYTTPNNVLCILHWFSGTPAAAARAARQGCYFSVNGAMLAHESGRSLVKTIPLENLLTETDAPFVKVGDRSSVPWDVVDTVERLSGLYGISSAEIAKAIASNARRVLAFAGVRPR